MPEGQLRAPPEARSSEGLPKWWESPPPVGLS